MHFRIFPIFRWLFNEFVVAGTDGYRLPQSTRVIHAHAICICFDPKHRFQRNPILILINLIEWRCIRGAMACRYFAELRNGVKQLIFEIILRLNAARQIASFPISLLSAFSPGVQLVNDWSQCSNVSIEQSNRRTLKIVNRTRWKMQRRRHKNPLSDFSFAWHIFHSFTHLAR